MNNKMPTDLEIFGCDWKEWADGIANSEFMKVAVEGGRSQVAEALAMVTVLVITEAQRFVAEGSYTKSVQLLNCLKRLICNPEEFMSLIEADVRPPSDDSVIH